MLEAGVAFAGASRGVRVYLIQIAENGVYRGVEAVEVEAIKAHLAPIRVGILIVLAQPSDEIDDVQNLGLWLELNGKRIQDSSTSDMIFRLATIVSYVSQHVLLQPGDVITTGTPPGVGLGMKPERFLKPGDVMELGVQGLGTQKQTVLAFEDSALA